MADVVSVDCDFDDAPLMIAVAHVTFTQSPEIIQHITSVKAGLGKLGLPLAEAKQHANFTVNQSGAAPTVTQTSFWWFTSPERRRAVAVGQNYLVFYDGQYSKFGDFVDFLKQANELVVSVAGEGCFLTAMALRYVSGFRSDGSPSPYLVTGLSGIPLASLETEHFHHQYNFWCDTAEGGKLVANVKTVHGHQLIPQDIQSAGVALDGKFALGKESDAVQIDIHETLQKREIHRLETAEVERIAGEMRNNIKKAFLAATTPDGHAKWKIKTKPSA